MSVETDVPGKELVQEREEKNQSNLSKRGGCYLLDQVNFLPYRGSSTRPRALIASLKSNISLASPPGLFLSAGLLSRLKSPRMSQSTYSGICIFFSQLVNAIFPGKVQGP